jgi:two-component system sensor histidine kinase VicK
MSADFSPVLTESIFQTIFEKSPGSLLVRADVPVFTIVAASDDYLSITSATRENIVGKGFFEMFPDDQDRDNEFSARKIFTRVALTGEKIVVPVYRYDVFDLETKIYVTHYWSCSNAPIYDAGNRLAYILNTVIDITAEVKAKEAAIENENRLRLAAEAASFGTWEFDLHSLSFIHSPYVAEIFGHAANDALSLEQLKKQVNAGDLENIVRKSFWESLVTGKFLYEVRICWPDDALHWVKVQGVVMTDDKNSPLSLLGAIVDTTESKRDEIRKSDFIAMASLELKTPLTSLKAYIQLLSKKLAATDDSFVTNALTKANQQVNRMTDLIHGFLDLSKQEPAKLKVKIQEFDMVKLVEESIADALLVSPQRMIEFESTGPITVAADRQKIGQVIGNFLSNAVKYSDKEGKISVSCKALGAEVEVAVKDEGIGIRLKDQAKLFQRFYRVESAKMKNISGFGIGLYLASEIIQRHKGTIGVESKENVGSRFYFTLPRG